MTHGEGTSPIVSRGLQERVASPPSHLHSILTTGSLCAQ
eukprot:CAMPEP_0114159744 /NCGR_PEP_ID=MMETSP0043_2-20121206/27953_1 /TAXON_ID=464988 /ORGANISM="Hemiselmis andersenii, Strain CCMP644" /LENGTH=38 /DNA_ID= /DNA_START= /DNA_END= /DNA_ORIENTATION=